MPSPRYRLTVAPYTGGAMRLVPPDALPPMTDDTLSLMLTTFEPATASPWQMDTYRFDVRRCADGVRVGHLNLRVSDDDDRTRYVGHVGYGVDEAHRGRGYAARAVRLVLPLAAGCGLPVVWITCGPDNPASRRTLENLGAELVDVVPVPADYPLPSAADRRKCRYRLPTVP